MTVYELVLIDFNGNETTPRLDESKNKLIELAQVYAEGLKTLAGFDHQINAQGHWVFYDSLGITRGSCFIREV